MEAETLAVTKGIVKKKVDKQQQYNNKARSPGILGKLFYGSQTREPSVLAAASSGGLMGCFRPGRHQVLERDEADNENNESVSVVPAYNEGTEEKSGGLGKTVLEAEVVEITELSPTSRLYRLKLFGQAHFMAGQYTCVYREPPEDYADGRQPETFPGTYSIASPPSDLPFVEFAVENDKNPRNMKHYMYNYTTVGARLWVEGVSYGSVAVTARMALTPLVWNGGRGGVCLLVGGFGIPGAMAIAKELLQNSEGHLLPHVTLVHSVRTPKSIPFFGQFRALEAKYSNFHVVHTVTGEDVPANEWYGRRGRVDDELLATIIPGTKLFVVFGSADFVQGMVAMLLDLGVWSGNIRTDYSSRVDPAKRLKEKAERAAAGMRTPDSAESRLVPADSSSSPLPLTPRATDPFLKSTGMARVLDELETGLAEKKPEYPIQYLMSRLQELLEVAPEVQNTEAGDPEFWVNYWEKDAMKWHAPTVSPWLIKYEHEFLEMGRRPGTPPSKTPGKPMRVFVPLSGKTTDMKYLLDKGYHVIGSDCSGIACEDFMREQSIPDYVRKEVFNDGKNRVVVHKSLSRPIELYEGDIFLLTPEMIGGKVDAILDRAALVALPPGCIEDQYIPLLVALSTPDAKTLLASVSALPAPVAPPHIYSAPQIEKVLKTGWEHVEWKHDHSYQLNQGIVTEPIYLLHTLKNRKL